jgi:iron(III) transport system permease protein
MRARHESQTGALALAVSACVAFAVMPWYWLDFSDTSHWGEYPFGPAGSALVLGLTDAWWLLPLILPLGLGVAGAMLPLGAPGRADRLVWAGGAGLAYTLLQGFTLGLKGWNAAWLATLMGGPGTAQAGFGLAAAIVLTVFLLLLCRGLAERGWCRGDAFVVSSIGVVIALVGLFVFFPVGKILTSAVQDNAGNFAPGLFLEKFLDESIWGLACVTSNLRCGVAWNTLLLGVLVGAGSTALGLAFALLATRGTIHGQKSLKILTVLPIITPPFVIGLAVILLFGRSGVVTGFLADTFDIARSRWIYGLPGVLLAQLLAFTPIAFLVLIGVVQGIAPSLEEAAQTLRASRWTTFRTVTWPLLRPGLANAFLLGFVESLADFGNPLVLAGNYELLSIKVFFAVVGAAHDQGRAAVLALVLLAFTLGAFYAQHRWLGRSSYTTVTGKGDTGLPMPLPKGVAWAAYGVAIPWAVLTFVIYGMILMGGLVKSMGRDHTFTFEHYLTGFRIDLSSPVPFAGSAWTSFWTTLEISVIAAPLTAVIGLLTAYLLARQRFAGHRTFEFVTMLSFAIPGTVIGVSYILAFNVPPIELTGTGVILVICFVFRNMPVGVRAGIATLSQIDKSLDEASLTLGARTGTTIRRIVLPLLRPAAVAAMVYSFVRAMTAVSAVIFLVTAEYNMATAYIVGRVEAGEFGLAIAYSSVLIVVMVVAILLIQFLVGERKLGRRGAAGVPVAAGG